jgi:hypothetical protein
MKKGKFWLILILNLMNMNHLLAQSAKISLEQTPLITYPYSEPNPIAVPGIIYPYFRFDGYSDKGVMQNWKMVEMENEYIKLWITPEIGGKIWGAVEKSTGKEFVYYNHVVKFRDVAKRGPWTSGGIEMNFGIYGHAPTCSSPVDYFMRKNDDGSVSCFVGAFDLPSRTRWSVEINLPKDKAFFTTRSVWDNPTGLEQSYYHWMNMGIKSAGNLEYIFPGNSYLGHDGKPSPWPFNEKGKEISFYENNNFGSYKSYHVFGEATGFFGAYWHDDDFGFAHYSTYDAKPGKKVWIWGLSNEGMIWEKLLTDTDGQYTEIQSGRLFNQAANESSITPFKNRGFAPGSTDEWTEFWFPVKQTQGLKSALPSGSVNLQQNGNKFSLWFCPNEKVVGSLEVRYGTKLIFAKEIHSEPMKAISDSFNYEGNCNSLSVWLGNKLLFDANLEKKAIKRPVMPAVGFNWETAYGHALKGKELERQRLFKSAWEEYMKSIEVEPFYVPALTGLANLAYRKSDYQSSLEYSLKALSVDTYDAGANMSYGLAELALGDTSSAIDGFSIASWAVSHRSAAFNALASVCMLQNDYTKALDYAEKSLQFNQLSSDAVQIKILCLRKLGLKDKAVIELKNLEEKDPLNHFIRFERFIADPSIENEAEVKNHIKFELPQETYLEYAIWYFRNGQGLDALKILALAPQDHPIVLFWEGYLNHLSGNAQIANVELAKALQLNPSFVFPFRVETLNPLKWAQTLSDNWKLNYYMGLIYLNSGDVEKGRSYWNGCGSDADFYPFYIARSRLYDVQSEQARDDIEKALELGSNDWQAGLCASKFYLERGNNLKAEELAKRFYGMFPQNYYLGLHYAKILEMNGNFKACVALMKGIKVLPNEGATEGRTIWHFANIGNALDMMKSKNYGKSLESIRLAREWPANIGIGEPYHTDQRLEDMISMFCFKKLKDDLNALKMVDRIIGKTMQLNLSSDVNYFLTAWLLKEGGNKSEGDKIMEQLQTNYPLSKSIQWCNAVYSGNSEQAEILSKGVDKNDQIFHFIKRLFDIMY